MDLTKFKSEDSDVIQRLYQETGDPKDAVGTYEEFMNLPLNEEYKIREYRVAKLRRLTQQIDEGYQILISKDISNNNVESAAAAGEQ